MDVITANSLNRVLEIQTSLGKGTAFTIDYGGPQHLLTARHLLPEGESHPEVTIANRFAAHTLRLDLLPVEPDTADIAVAPLEKPVTPELPITPNRDGIIY